MAVKRTKPHAVPPQDAQAGPKFSPANFVANSTSAPAHSVSLPPPLHPLQVDLRQDVYAGVPFSIFTPHLQHLLHVSLDDVGLYLQHSTGDSALHMLHLGLCTVARHTQNPTANITINETDTAREPRR